MQYKTNYRRQIFQLCVLLLITQAVMVAQSQTQQTEKEKQDQSKSKNETKKEDAKSPSAGQPTAPAPLFEGKSTLKSSRQGKETATAGFNGVNPDGEIQKKVLAASPTSDDQAHVAAMSASSTDPAELATFEKEGKLNTPK